MQLEIISRKEDVKPEVLQTTRIFTQIGTALKEGYTVISEQGSSRSSKTYNTILFLIIYALIHKGLRISVVRATLPSLKASAFVDFKDILCKMGIFDERQLNKSDFIYRMPGGSWFEFFSTDSEQKIRGRKRDILYVNEANELLFIEWQQLKMRTTLFAIVDYNPSFSDDHWLCGLNSDPHTFHFISTYKDNPFLEQTIIDEIESLQHKNKTLWQVYGLGLQAQVEGLVFPTVELVDEIPQWVQKRGLGMDFGYTNDPTAIIECAVLDDSLYLDEQCFRTRMLTNDIIHFLKSSSHRVMSESADPRLVDEIGNAGINIYKVSKTKDSVIAGIVKMLEYKIKITKRSVNLIKEFRNYTYMQDKDGKWLNEPIDAYNHGIDAARYWVWGEILGRIQKPANDDGVFF